MWIMKNILRKGRLPSRDSGDTKESNSNTFSSAGAIGIKAAESLKYPISSYTCLTVIYTFILASREPIVINSFVFNGVIAIWNLIMMLLFRLQTKNHNPKLCRLTYFILSSHICFQELFVSRQSIAQTDHLFLSSLRMVLPVTLGVSWKISSTLVILFQALISASNSVFLGLSDASIEQYIYIWSEFLVIILIFLQLRSSLGHQSDGIVYEDEDTLSNDQKKGSFISRVAYDLGTHLTTLRLTVEALFLTDLTDEQLEMVESFETTIDFMTVVRLDYFDIGRHANGHLPVPIISSVSLLQVIVNCERVMRNYAGVADVSIEFYMSPTLASSVQLDANWLWSMLVNLLSNAKKFASTGPILVTFFIVPKSGKNESRKMLSDSSSSEYVRLTDEGHMLRIEVADLGPGIPPHRSNSVFKPFTQLSNQDNKGGAGIGLHSVKTKATVLGGQAGVRPNSLAGKGSVFWIEVPYLPTQTVETKKAETEEPSLGKLLLYGNVRKVFSEPSMKSITMHFHDVLPVSTTETFKEHRNEKLNIILCIMCILEDAVDSQVDLENNIFCSPSRSSDSNLIPKNGNEVTFQRPPNSMQLACRELDRLPDHEGESLGMIVLYDNWGSCFTKKEVGLLRDEASLKHWHLVCGSGMMLQLDVIGIITRQACRHSSTMPCEFQSHSQIEKSYSQRSMYTRGTYDTGNKYFFKSIENSRSRRSRFSTSEDHSFSPKRYTSRLNKPPVPRTMKNMEFSEISHSIQEDGVSEKKGTDFMDELSGSTSSKHVLIISDDKSILKLLSRMLMKVGYSISVAFNAKEGLDFMRRMIYHAVVITDMIVFYDSYEQITRFRQWEQQKYFNKSAQTLQHIVLLGSERVFREDAEKSGVDVFVPKPYKFFQLMAAIENSDENISNNENTLSFFSFKSGFERSMVSAFSKNFRNGNHLRANITTNTATNETDESVKNPQLTPSYNSFNAFCSSELQILSSMFEERKNMASSGTTGSILQVNIFNDNSHVSPDNLVEKAPMSCLNVASGPNSPQKRLLIVDNDKVLCSHIENTMSKEGYEVSITNNGLKGLVMMKKNVFDAVIIDASLPLLDGKEAVKRFREWESEQLRRKNRKSAQYIIMPKNEDEDLASVGIDDYLRKPYKASNLVDLLREKGKMSEGGNFHPF